MVYTKEAIDLLQLLRRRFRDEDIGLLHLNDPEALEHVIVWAQRSTNGETKDLAFKLAQIANMPLSRRDLERAPGEMSRRLYRGQEILVERKSREDGNERPVRMYRGQVVA
ncbi:hypothetical protein O5O45_27375 [Hahella aquimaris]|uniref:hypothetical protein n=1 Tax=Hahella sp. HNIBRBA332 TaxID=3015983 RepID=UPI00273C4FC0|nr:hypothetical protein [Hahella sp. HNIBRBA332]WLQ13452.1 hypothetical protein O5O45_27375 [Hahella sp. HNIBRBA332]